MDLKDAYQKYMWAPFTQMGDLGDDEPLVMVGGEGATVIDESGRSFVEGHGGLWLANVGYGRREVIEAIYEQLNRLNWFPSFLGMSNDTAVRLAERLIKMTAEEGMARTFFTCSGSESVESALKMARQYWRLAGQHRYKIISRHMSYHGVSMGALSATGVSANRRLFEPLVPGFRHISAPHCYRCPYGLEEDKCALECARELERTILFESPDTVAAFIAEPVIGAGGVVIPPDGYWQEIERICRRYDVLIIADEVITGFGRTGREFGCRHWGVKPDMMTFAKGLTSGYIPFGATLVKEEIFNMCLGRWGEGREFRHGGTYSGHPAGCAAAFANLDVVEKEGLVERARSMGDYLLKRLRELMEIPVVGNVAGIGLLARLEIVKDKETKAPFPAKEMTGLKVSRQMLKRGVILRPLGDIISFSPPLVISRQQIDTIIDSLKEVLWELAEANR